SDFRSLCLDEAVHAIDRKRDQPDAAYRLASALWRKREMSRHIFYEPAPQSRPARPLTNDFATLLQWFPNSPEARSLVEITNRGEGNYTEVEPADRRYLAAVYTNFVMLPATKASDDPTAVPVTTDAQRLTRLNEYLSNRQIAPAWQLANTLHVSRYETNQLNAIFGHLLQTVKQQAEQYHDFVAAVNRGNPGQVLELGRGLTNCVDRRDRADVIKQCAEVIRKQQGVQEQLKYLFEQARQYRDDFLVDAVTGLPVKQIEYQFIEGPDLVQPVAGGADYGYEPLMGTVAEIAHDQPPSPLTRDVLDYIRHDSVLPLEKRLTAAYDLAEWEQAQGNDFEALELLKDILQQTQGTGLPLRRSDRWSQTIESAASDAVRKIRVYTGAADGIENCCGPVSTPQKPANYDAMNQWLGQLWQQQIGNAGTNYPPVDEQLLARKDEVLPTLLYKLKAGEEVSHMELFCVALGTNALPALPLLMEVIHRGKPFQDYNNALAAVGALGHVAGCAKPLLILARENGDNGNFKYALRSIGPAPSRVMPQLAQLLYHKNPEVCKLAARAMTETAQLHSLQKLPDEQKVIQVRQWWETTGQSRQWGQPNQ
ncbi:MAG TPA: hypothetical protein VN625_01705, partial [Desulfuromonadaceae bacterium]|nr:hypothetical protein [Desulfuromonadaceae bacterium]